MIIFLYGPDDYRRLRKKQEIVAEFLTHHSNLGLGSFDMAAPGTVLDLAEFLRSQSMFEIKKLALLHNLFPTRKGAEDDEDTQEPIVKNHEKKENAEIIKLLEKYVAVENITIVISESKKPVKAYGFLIEPPVRFHEFETLTGSKWEWFIQSEANKCKLALTPPAIRLLAEAYQGNTWGLATELQKIGTFKHTLDRNDLDELGLTAAPNYWGLLNGVKSYDIRARLGALETLFAMSDPAPKLFNILASQWREKTASMAAYDLAIKSGKLDYEEALVDLVIA